MKRAFYTLIVMLFALAGLQGTLIIDPAADGGFENGNTFDSNGWTVVNHGTNNWYVGAPGLHSGTNGAFISNDGGVTNAYSISPTQTSHFYRDITIPTGEVPLLNFNWRGQGESTWDRLLVYIAPTSVTPVAGTPASSSTVLTGATLLGMFNLQTTWQTANISLIGYTGVQRLIFTWQNDASVMNQPPISVDNISLSTFIPNPLMGTKVIGSVMPYDYPSFTAAITALNLNGVGAGGVTFTVQDGTYTENPPPITVGGTEENPVVFQAAMGANPVLVPTGGTGSFGFKIEGADYITFDNIDINGPNNLIYGYWINGLAGNGATNITIQNCTINVPYGSTSNYGIYATQASTPNSDCTYLNNTVLNSYYGIYLSGNATVGNENQNTNINRNTISGIRYYGIYLSYGQNCDIQYNNIAFLDGSTTTAYGIYVIGASGSYYVHHNVIDGGYTSSTVYALYQSSGTGIWEYNEVTNLYNTSSSGWYGMYASGGETTWRYNTIYGIANTGTGSFYGAYISTGNHTFIRNQIYSVRSGGTALYGMYIAGGTSHTLNGNLLRDLNYTGTGAGVVYGIHVASGTTNNVYNNMICDLRAAASTSSNANPAIRGISITSGTNDNIWNNTVYLNASGANTAFSTAGLYVTATTNTIDLKNNIIVNKSVPGATGRSIAFWKSTAGVNNITATSDKNIYFTVEEPIANQAMGYFASTTFPTLDDYKNMTVTKDLGSYWEDVPFVSSSGNIDVHIDRGIPTRAEGNAIPIQPPVTMDFDNHPRDPVTPDIGADEGEFTPVGGAPGCVTLLSPSDGATGLDPISLEVSWSAPADGGTPLNYYVFISTEQDDFFGNQIGYYEVEHPTTSLDLAIIPDLNLECLTQYYWAVQAHNNEGDSDPRDPAFQIWGFTTMQRMTGPATMDFGDAWPELVMNRTLPIMNHGPGLMRISAAGPAEFQFPLSMVDIPAYSTYDLAYTFTVPATIGAYTGQITITQTSPGNSVLQIGVTANVTTDVAVGDGSSNLYLPIYGYYGYSYSQTIYPAQWLNYPDGYRIEALQYFWNPALAPVNNTAFQVWMGHTDQEQFPATVNNTSWIPVSEMIKVFEGDWIITAGSGWKELTLQVPFIYNRSQNLVIAVRELTPGYDSSGNSTSSFFRCTPTTGSYHGMSCYSDTNIFDPYNPEAIAPSSFTGYGSRQGYPNTRFILGAAPTGPELYPSPSTWDFGTVIINDTVEKEISISNFGSGILTISSISLSDETHFELLNLPTLPVNIPSGQNIPPFTLRYNPGAVGTHAETINFVANVPSDPITIFGECVDPRISSLPHTQNFDGVVAPDLPLGWTAYKSNAASQLKTYTTYSNTPPNCVYFYPQTANEVMRLISPQVLVPINQIKLKVYMRAGATTYTMKVGTVSALDGSGVFTEVAAITNVSTSAFTQYTVSFADYTGTDQYICFQHGATSTYQSFYLDDVELEMLMPIDLAATAITGPSYGISGAELNYGITVYNNGTVEVNSYTVYLKDIDGGILATQVINLPLPPNQSATHQLTWITEDGGNYQIYGQVMAFGDGNATNNATAAKSIFVFDSSMTQLAVGDDNTTTSGYSLPINLWFRNSVTEQLYFEDEMRLDSGTISAIIYKYIGTNAREGKAIKIWMSTTTATDLTGGWIPAENYSLVFDGNVDFPAGEHAIIIPLSTPFIYTGGNLATRVYRVFDSGAISSTEKFYYTTTPLHTNRSRYLQNDTTVYDPMNPAAGGTGTALNYVSNTTFVVQNAVLQPHAKLEGYVRDAAINPIVGATVTLTDERYSTTTDADGYYSFIFWEAHNVSLNATKHGYYPYNTPGIELTVGTVITQNIILTAMPRVPVMGSVIGNDGLAIEGAKVQLNGIENYQAFTDANGLFTITNVLGSNMGVDYTITVTFAGYNGYSGTVTALEDDVELDPITLIEKLWPAYNLEANHDNGNVSLAWDEASEPPYFFWDFEDDNGGWVSGGYGDWEWGNTYPTGGTFNWTDYATSCVPPAAAHSGTGLWGTKLYTNYSNSGAWSYLTKTVNLAGIENPQLRFWRWNNLFGDFDYYQVQVNGTMVFEDKVLQNAWAEKVVNLSAYANQEITIRFAVWATATVAYAGLYIDDVYIGPPPAPAGRATQDRSLQGYNVYRMLAADQGNEANWNLLDSNVEGPTYTDDSFSAATGGKYKWAVKATYDGNHLSPAIISNQLGRVYTPQDITVEKIGANIKLSWTSEPGATFYRVYDADTPDGPWQPLGNTGSIIYNTSATPGKKFFKVTAVADETRGDQRE